MGDARAQSHFPRIFCVPSKILSPPLAFFGAMACEAAPNAFAGEESDCPEIGAGWKVIKRRRASGTRNNQARIS